MRSEQRRIFAFITSQCLNSCRYCFMDQCRGKELSAEDFRRVCEYAVRQDCHQLTFIGGEPLLHPGLPAMMQTAREYGIRVSVSTSGNPPSKMPEAFALPVDDVTLSLDSPVPEENDAYRGEGAFARSMAAARFLRERGADVRFTATLHRGNYRQVFRLAERVREEGAFQLDIHVMSLIGRAQSLEDISLPPEEWYAVRRELDAAKFTAPFTVSYPVMWYRGDEFDHLAGWCDARQGTRLSVMPDMGCYYCTVAIGDMSRRLAFSDGMAAEAAERYDAGTDYGLCAVERQIGTASGGFKYLCRFYKQKTGFVGEQ